VVTEKRAIVDYARIKLQTKIGSGATSAAQDCWMVNKESLSRRMVFDELYNLY